MVGPPSSSTSSSALVHLPLTAHPTKQCLSAVAESLLDRGFACGRRNARLGSDVGAPEQDSWLVFDGSLLHTAGRRVGAADEAHLTLMFGF